MGINLDPMTAQLATQLAIAAVLGGVLGIERRFRRKPAGLRTYALVSMGSCLFVVLSLFGLGDFQYASSLDPSRVLSQIIVGVGFLGAGIIFQSREEVHGLTTAAGLWVTAGIGAAVGLGLYELAAITTVISLLIFFVLFFFESKIPQDGH